MNPKFVKLLEAARGARDRAYAPYSNFYVGAALLSKEGNIYTGCNVENMSYGLTICAERNAVFKMIEAGDREIEEILIIGKTPEPLFPCGACRQVIAEFATAETRIYMCDEAGRARTSSMAEILPFNFTLFKDQDNE